jgi:hypothetical protein
MTDLDLIGRVGLVTGKNGSVTVWIDGPIASIIRAVNDAAKTPADFSISAPGERFSSSYPYQCVWPMEMASSSDATYQGLRVMKAMNPDYLSLPLSSAPRKFWELQVHVRLKERKA